MQDSLSPIQHDPPLTEAGPSTPPENFRPAIADRAARLAAKVARFLLDEPHNECDLGRFCSPVWRGPALSTPELPLERTGGAR